MSLAQQVLDARDREAVRVLVDRSELADLVDAVEPLAGEVVRLLRVDARKAYEVAERAELVAASSSDERSRARSRWVKGHVLWGVSRIPEALEAYRAAERAYRSLGAPDEALRIAIGQVNALAWLGRYREAMELGEKTRKALVRAKQPDAVARLDLNLGNVHHWSGRPREALARYDRALRFARSRNDPAMTRMVQMNRGTQLSALGRLEAAEKVFRDVREGASESGERRNAAVADYNLGYILFQRGDYGAAYDTLDAARVAFEELGDDLYLTGTLIDLAELLIEVNESRRAFRLAEEARERAERQGLRFERGRAALLQGVASLGNGASAEARDLLEHALAAFREEGRTSLGAMCDVYLAEIDRRAGEAGSADRRLRRALAVFRAEGMK
ncbi:MAG TPA: tetratricopeptide repeat protein, partial [bacterium]|nr:tetratricopeptide repeat protein [bacterium]